MPVNPVRRLLTLQLRMPLQLILIVPFAIQIVAVVGLTGYLAHRNGQKAVQDLASQLMDELGDHVNERLNNYLEEPLLITQINTDAARIGQLALKNLSVIENRFILQMQRFESVQEIYLGTADGDYLGVSRTPESSLGSFASQGYYQGLLKQRDPLVERISPLKSLDDFDPRTRPWYNAALKRGQATWSPIYPFIRGEFGITAVQPFYDRGGNLQGVMAVDLILTVLSDFLRRLKLTPSGEIFILERSGELVATSTYEPLYQINPDNAQEFRIPGVESQDPLTRATIKHLIESVGSLGDINQVEQLDFKINGERHFLEVSPYSDGYGLDWLIVVVVPEADFMGQINASRRTTIILCLGALGLATGLGLFTSRWIARQILQLARATQAIAFGQLDQTVHSARVSELEVLAESFNQMARQLKSAFEVLEIRVEERTTQLKDVNQLLREEIWERKQVERALRLSENKFSKAFHSNPNPSLITRLIDGYILEFNESALKFFGYTSVEVANKNTLELKIWADSEDQERIFEQLDRQGIIRSFESNFITKSGEIRIGLYSAELIDLNGQTCVLSIIHDITERKQTELTLQNRSQIDHLISRIFQQFVDQDVNTAINFALAEIGKLTHSDRCYVVQYADRERQYIKMTHEWCNENIPSVMEKVQEMSVKPLSWSYQQLQNNNIIHLPNLEDLPSEAINEKRNWKLEGTQSVLAVPMISTGEIVGSVGCSMVRCTKEWSPEEIKLIQRVGEMIPIGLERDIAEQKLKESQERLAGILDNAEDAIISVDEDQNILLFNHGAEKIFGYSPAEAIGQSLDMLLPMKARTVHHQYVGDFSRLECQSRKMGERSREVCGRRKSGEEFPAEASISKLKIRDGWIYTAILKDITQRKQAEMVLEQAKDAAEAANRAKSEFLANMSHELRTPLNAILGFSQLMSRDPSLTPDQQNSLNIINSSGEHLLTLINSILDLSKIEAGRMTLNENSFDLHRLLNSLEKMLHLKVATKGLSLEFEREENVPQFIKTDESKLRQVLINLLGNAIKYTEKGGVSLRVQQENLPDDSPEDTVNLVFEISDTGTGIAPEEIPTIFDAFVQTATGRKSQQGTGLGLPISRKFVQMIGGDITVKSILGSGTTFKFNIRVTPTDACDIRREKPSQTAIGLESGQRDYRILVVDDQWQNRELLSRLLISVGFQVKEAENGQEAVEIWNSWRPDFIWMDMRMPILDGYEATQQIRASSEGDKVVIVALTASAFEQDRGAVLEAGCNDFVGKPFREEIIFEKLAYYLGVRYIYQPKTPSNDLNPSSNSEEILEKIEPVHLQMMSQDWLTQMQQAALVGRDGQMLELIQAIPPSHSSVAKALTQMVENFEFDRIVELISPEIHPEE
ncbi:PAS domain S-box protein [Capilliphycus salinus ALCB114379]|uniref:PAS domain S-box protein n=1 Tax=Capilliphycus salinus TaxID=2768948 RepID=UPI0039A4012F